MLKSARRFTNSLKMVSKYTTAS